MSSLSNWFSSNHSISGKSLALGAAALSLGSVGIGSLLSNWFKKCSVSCCSLKKESDTPLVVVVTGAAGQIGYNIIFSIACGRLLGNRKIELRLVEMPNVLKTLQGIVMELEDCAFPLLTKVVTTDDPRVAFKDADIALLIGAKPRAPGQERNDLLKANAEIFREQGKAINDVAKKTIKVLVVGNPANTNALIAMTNAPSIPKENFSAMTRLDENRAKSQIAKRLNVSVSRLHKIAIWGNHSSTQYPSVSHAEFTTDDGKRVPLKSVLNTPADEEYLKKEFISTVQKRGAAVLEAMSRSSAASAANAAIEHVHDWILGTKDNEWASMAVVSDNNGYGVSDGLIYSFPCVCKNGQWTIVKGLPLNSFDNELLQKTERELQEEKAAALSLPPRAAAASSSSSSSSA